MLHDLWISMTVSDTFVTVAQTFKMLTACSKTADCCLWLIKFCQLLAAKWIPSKSKEIPFLYKYLVVKKFVLIEQWMMKMENTVVYWYSLPFVSRYCNLWLSDSQLIALVNWFSAQISQSVINNFVYMHHGFESIQKWLSVIDTRGTGCNKSYWTSSRIYSA